MNNCYPGDLIKIDSRNFLLYRRLSMSGIPYDAYDAFLNDNNSSLSMIISSIELKSAWKKVYYVITIYGVFYLFEARTSNM